MQGFRLIAMVLRRSEKAKPTAVITSRIFARAEISSPDRRSVGQRGSLTNKTLLLHHLFLLLSLKKASRRTLAFQYYNTIPELSTSKSRRKFANSEGVAFFPTSYEPG
ncbi:uncharacterized protein LOC111249642 [Varroa destructor]|uniref:Uncharacterized protein n=1 Tax=Varroa destructor TaxID=109461 RepID=A0A7M7JZH9_VARDE|nr:uncharacterized protein LOC111249642 [Varroa destructor]